jgi:hypothetical protein
VVTGRILGPAAVVVGGQDAVSAGCAARIGPELVSVRKLALPFVSFGSVVQGRQARPAAADPYRAVTSHAVGADIFRR